MSLQQKLGKKKKKKDSIDLITFSSKRLFIFS